MKEYTAKAIEPTLDPMGLIRLPVQFAGEVIGVRLSKPEAIELGNKLIKLGEEDAPGQ